MYLRNTKRLSKFVGCTCDRYSRLLLRSSRRNRWDSRIVRNPGVNQTYRYVAAYKRNASIIFYIKRQRVIYSRHEKQPVRFACNFSLNLQRTPTWLLLEF